MLFRSNDTATTEIYTSLHTLSLHDALPISLVSGREGGTGLGLSLAQTFVQYHQGVIEFESRPGRTIFRILLPLT